MGIVITKMSKKMSILNIDSVSGIHRGTYHCVATNAAGSANHSAVLEVNGITTPDTLACLVASRTPLPYIPVKIKIYIQSLRK